MLLSNWGRGPQERKKKHKGRGAVITQKGKRK